MKRPVYALIDCNNFFVSCERLFRPDLATKPVIVLSSNDGCAVSRSNEAKALGVPMAAPAFKHRQLLRDGGVVQFSANFDLYGDISRRLTELLCEITPRIEVYSVDESFLDLSELPVDDYVAWAKQARADILQRLGIPVSIGIASSKTLCKIATQRAKQEPSLGGACDLYHSSDEVVRQHLASVSVEQVWGVGWRLSPQLRAEGVATAADLAAMRPQHAKQLMGIHGSQMVLELNGTSCIPLERKHKLAKSIARTRTFGEDTGQAHIIEAALASFTTQAAFRLRVSNQLTRRIGVFLTTDRHKPGYKRWAGEVIFRTPTADTGLLISQIVAKFSELYDKRVLYHRAGIVLHDFVPADQVQTDLLGEVSVGKHAKSQARLQAVDQLNQRYGKRTVKYASEELGKAWQPRYNLRSPRSTTRWDELASARILT